jgi:hypothetical protein
VKSTLGLEMIDVRGIKKATGRYVFDPGRHHGSPGSALGKGIKNRGIARKPTPGKQTRTHRIEEWRQPWRLGTI